MNRRGVSPVVATVLLLVLTIVIGSVVFSVVLPFVNKSLGESKACLDIFDSVDLPESKFNCVDISRSETGFSIKINKEGITAVRVALTDSNGNSQVYDITEGFSDRHLKMVGGNYGDPLTFPNVGGQKTYATDAAYEKVELSALTPSGEVCSIADKIELKACIGVTF